MTSNPLVTVPILELRAKWVKRNLTRTEYWVVGSGVGQGNINGSASLQLGISRRIKKEWRSVGDSPVAGGACFESALQRAPIFPGRGIC